MKTKIAIGCLIQWYEVNIVDEYLESLKNCIQFYGNEENIYLDFEIHIGTMLEKPTSLEPISVESLGNTIMTKLTAFEKNFPKVNISKYVRKNLTTIADYRRSFNSMYSKIADVLVWGETDMLAPREMIYCIDMLHNHESKKSSKYVATFAITKMWDDSWKHLEHRLVQDKPFIEGDTENWWSVRYKMSLDKLYQINAGEESCELLEFSNLKFNGCGLVISSEVVRCGVNIPESIFFVHEDTAFLNMCKRVFPNMKQYHFSNILLAHNRKHPNKRSYIEGEEGIDKTDMGALRKSHAWYPLANKYCEDNCNNLFDLEYVSKSWQDVFKSIQH